MVVSCLPAKEARIPRNPSDGLLVDETYRSVVKDQRPSEAHLIHNCREFTRHLHGSLNGVNWHQEDTKECSGSRGSHRFDSDGQVFRRFQGIHGGQNSCVGSRITKATEWTLQQGWKDTL